VEGPAARRCSGRALIYRSPRTGRQYVVISVGGIGHAADVSDTIIAFALPQKGASTH
jgi:glucose dehydrogenase